MKIIYVLIFILCCFGCSFLTQQSPFANINELGVVLSENESITIPTTNGVVTIKYVSPVERRIIWKGESRKIKLLKSKEINGIYHPNCLFKTPISNIHGVGYAESTTVVYTTKEKMEYVNFLKKLGFVCLKNNLFAQAEERKSFGFSWRPLPTYYLSIAIIKLEKSEPKTK